MNNFFFFFFLIQVNKLLGNGNSWNFQWKRGESQHGIIIRIPLNINKASIEKKQNSAKYQKDDEEVSMTPCQICDVNGDKT